MWALQPLVSPSFSPTVGWPSHRCLLSFSSALESDWPCSFPICFDLLSRPLPLTLLTLVGLLSQRHPKIEGLMVDLEFIRFGAFWCWVTVDNRRRWFPDGGWWCLIISSVPWMVIWGLGGLVGYWLSLLAGSRRPLIVGAIGDWRLAVGDG